MRLPFPLLSTVLLSALALLTSSLTRADEPLPSWQDRTARQAIVDFVNRVTDPDSPDLVPPEQRIAVFDNDGTLWVEQPIYTQLAFVLDRLKALSADHPELAERQPFKAALAGDTETLGDSGMEGLMELLMATHAGMTEAEFEQLASDWITQARHPRFEHTYTALVYQPMLELLAYLREHGFTTYIVSGGGVAFMRPWTEAVYGIPPEQVIGSRIALEYGSEKGEPALIRQAEIAFINDKAGKPVGIAERIGRRPLLAFGNSDGDYQMLEWTTAGEGPRLGLLLHHDDAEREYAYDRDSHIGCLDQGLDDAAEQGWVLVSMRKDWKTVFPASSDTALSR